MGVVLVVFHCSVEVLVFSIHLNNINKGFLNESLQALCNGCNWSGLDDSFYFKSLVFLSISPNSNVIRYKAANEYWIRNNKHNKIINLPGPQGVYRVNKFFIYLLLYLREQVNTLYCKIYSECNYLFRFLPRDPCLKLLAVPQPWKQA